MVDELSDEQLGLLTAIVDGRKLYVAVGELNEHHPEVLAGLLELGIVELWGVDRSGRAIAGGPYATLTCYGAWLAKTVIVEGLIHDDEQIEIQLDEGRPTWRARAADSMGDPIPSLIHVRIPGHPGTRRLPFPEAVEDPAPPPEYLVDEFNGEVVILFREHPISISSRKIKGKR